MKLSIITVNKNNYKGLEKTIASVIEQTNKDYEFIVVDGNSTDQSLEIIKKYAFGIHHWFHEEDNGIYNAMNKGIRKAEGEYCLFLNSGDWLVNNDTLQKVINELESTPLADIYYTGCMATNKIYFQPPKTIDINYLVLHNLNHQNSLIKRSLFIEHGLYDEGFKIAADYHFWLRAFWCHNVTFQYIDTNIAFYDSKGFSTYSKYDNELEHAVRLVFGSLADSVIKLRRYCHGPYGSIVEYYGNFKSLSFLLKLYRRIVLIFKPKIYTLHYDVKQAKTSS